MYFPKLIFSIRFFLAKLKSILIWIKRRTHFLKALQCLACFEIEEKVKENVIIIKESEWVERRKLALFVTESLK